MTTSAALVVYQCGTCRDQLGQIHRSSYGPRFFGQLAMSKRRNRTPVEKRSRAARIDGQILYPGADPVLDETTTDYLELGVNIDDPAPLTMSCRCGDRSISVESALAHLAEQSTRAKRRDLRVVRVNVKSGGRSTIA